MRIEISKRVNVFEKELKKLVNKTIKKNINNYPNYFKESIDMDNIFDSMFDIDITTKKTQDDLSNFTNPYIVKENGNSVYIKELTNYSMMKYLISFMRNKSVEERHKHFNQELNYNKFFLEPYFADIIGEIISKFKNEYDMKFLRDMLTFSLNQQDERDSLFFKLEKEEIDDYIRICEVAGVKKDYFNSLMAIEPVARNIMIQNNVMVLGNIYWRKVSLEVREAEYRTNSPADEEMKKMNKALYSHKKVKELALQQLEDLLKFIEKKNQVASGVRDIFLHKLQSNFIETKGLSYYEKDTMRSNKLYVENELEKINEIFNCYRENKLKWILDESIFEKSPSVNYIKINKAEYDLKVRKGINIIKGIVDEMAGTILALKSDDREKLLFKSMRFLERSDDMQILFNMNEKIKIEDKKLLINDVEDLILRVLKNDFEAGFWKHENKDSFEFDLLTNIKEEFRNINREHTLWLKIKEAPKEMAQTVKKRKI